MLFEIAIDGGLKIGERVEDTASDTFSDYI
jgi:hypothetical protein